MGLYLQGYALSGQQNAYNMMQKYAKWINTMLALHRSCYGNITIKGIQIVCMCVCVCACVCVCVMAGGGTKTNINMRSKTLSRLKLIYHHPIQFFSFFFCILYTATIQGSSDIVDRSCSDTMSDVTLNTSILHHSSFFYIHKSKLISSSETVI